MTVAHEARVLRRSIAATLLVSALGIGFGLASGAQSIIFDGVFSVLDARGWLLSALITSALLAAFVAGAVLDGTPHAWLTPYVDPAVLMVLTLCLLPVPARIVWRAATEIFLMTPDTLDARVRRVMDAVVARHGFTTYSSYAAKVGRGRFIEIHVVVPADHPGTTAWFDGIRREIGEALGEAGPHRWLTIVFTTDPTWI